MSGSGRGDADGGRRQVVKFSFYRVDPAWRLLPEDRRVRGKEEFGRAVDSFADKLQVRAYSVMGMRGDADFLLWQIGERLEDIQELATALMRTTMGPHLSMPYSYLAMTRKSVYVSLEEASARLHLHPADSNYFFVYPFVKTRAWYALSLDERQRMMNVHIAVGRKYPSVKLNTTYSFGLDDQEFVVSFETDEPADFLDLVMELREAESSLYTLRDTPIFTCISMSLREALDTLGAPGDAVETPVSKVPASAEWNRVASLDEISEAARKVVYHHGEQVALFRSGDSVLAVANRCSHANGPLADGRLENGEIACPYHGSRFSLETGEPSCGPANRPVPVYDVRVEDGTVWLGPAKTLAGEPARD